MLRAHVPFSLATTQRQVRNHRNRQHQRSVITLFPCCPSLAASVCTWVLHVSLVNRNGLVNHSGDLLLCVTLFWSCFLPLGSVASVDTALRKARAAVPAVSYSCADPSPPSMRICSVASAAYKGQAAMLYFFSALHKAGPSWRETHSAVARALEIRYLLRPEGAMLRDALGPALLSLLTRATLLFEGYAWLAFFTPWDFVVAPVVLAFMAMHLSFGLCLAIQLFPFFDIAQLSALLPGSVVSRGLVALGGVWAACGGGRKASLRQSRLAVEWRDGDAPALTASASALACEFLALRNVRLAQGAALDTRTAVTERQTTWWLRVWLLANRRSHGGEESHSRVDDFRSIDLTDSVTDWAALLLLARASPWAAPVAALIQHALGMCVAYRQRIFSSALRQVHPPEASPAAPAVHLCSANDGHGLAGAPLLSPKRTWALALIVTCRDVVLSLLFLAVVWENRAGLPPYTALFSSPGYVFEASTTVSRLEQAAILALKLDQKWNMFAPDPCDWDFYVVITGLRRDGRVVDLFRDVLLEPGVTTDMQFHEPTFHAMEYRSWRWTKLFENLHTIEQLHMVENLARWLCRRSNHDPASGYRDLRLPPTRPDHVITFEWYYMWRNIKEDGSHRGEPWNKWLVWEHRCFDEPPAPASLGTSTCAVDDTGREASTNSSNGAATASTVSATLAGDSDSAVPV